MDEIEKQVKDERRPFLLAILCFSVFVYSSVFVLIFSATAIFNNWIYFVLNDYLPDNGINKSIILWLSIAGILLYGGSFLGAFYIWKLKRIGFFLFVLASGLIALIPFLFGFGSTINVIVFSSLITAFLFFYRKFK
jgi:hypothetical protein